MSISSKRHWATLLAIGLPLLAGGCAGGGWSSPEADPAATQARAARVHPQTLADRLKAEGKCSSAIPMYQQAYHGNPGDVRPLLGMGDCFLAMGANAEAAEAYGGALAQQPNNLDALRGLGHARILLGQPQFALTQYQTAVKLAPKDVRALNGLGVAQDMVGDHAAAQQTYRTVLTIDPNNQSAKNNMALSLALSGDNEAAIAMLEELSKSATASAVNRQNLALVYGVSGKPNEAEQVGRADLPEHQARKNAAVLAATADPAARQEMLKKSLGVELKGLQYTPAQQAVPLTTLAQAPMTEQQVYLSAQEGEPLPLITTGAAATPATAASTAASTATVTRRSTGDAWSDDWDEELVDAADIARGDTAASAASVPEPLPSLLVGADGALIASTQGTDAASSPFLSTKKAIGEKEKKATETAAAETGGTTPSTPATATTATATSASGATQVAAATPPQKTQTPAVLTPDKPMGATASTAKPMTAATETSKPQTAAATAATTSAKPESPATTEPTATATVTAKELGGAKVYTVQIASYRTESEATAGWQTLSAAQKDLLAGLPHTVAKADLGADKGIYYRLQAGSFDDRNAAKALCTDLKSRAIECMVVEATTTSPAPAAKAQQSEAAADKPIIVGAR